MVIATIQTIFMVQYESLLLIYCCGATGMLCSGILSLSTTVIVAFGYLHTKLEMQVHEELNARLFKFTGGSSP
jgi:hypothetical protein